MKMAYVTTYDSSNLHEWSGLGYSIRSALQTSGFEIEPIGNLTERYSLAFKLTGAATKTLFKKTYLRDREPVILRSYARQVEQSLAGMNADVIFSPGTVPIAYLRTDKPIVFWTDATFAGMVDFYPQFSALSKRSLREGQRMEQAALSKARLAIYASEWAAKTAIDNYDVDPDKVKVVPFGANFETSPTLDDAQRVMNARGLDTCRLLFVGVEWLRKGGDLALAVARSLNDRGLKTELHVVGCMPPEGMPDFVKAHGFLSKKDQAQREKLQGLFETSHFFIMPSRAECFAVVLAEASSYALPSLATNIGGIPSAVSDGINGRIFDPHTFVQQCSDYVFQAFQVKEGYGQLCLSSYRRFQDRLNWRSAAQDVGKLIRQYCSPQPS